MISRRKLLMCCTALSASALSVIGHSAVASTEDRSVLTLFKDGDDGEKLNLRGRVIDADGKAIGGARVGLRHADANANYTPQYEGELFTAADGTFKVRTVLPGQYTSAKHIHVFVYAEGHQAVQTTILFKGDPNIDLGSSGGLEVLLEQVHKGEEVIHVGGVELQMGRQS